MIPFHSSRAAGVLAALLCLFCLAPEARLLQITFLGDVMLGRGVDQAAGREQDWQPFAKLQPVTAWTDILAANLESPLTDAPAAAHGYMLCAPPVRVEALQAASFDLMTVANNHILDCGEAGSRQTLSVLHANNIQTAGPDLEPVFISKQGKKLAFMAINDVANPVDLPRVSAAVESAAQHSDLVIVSIHWGSEYQPAPSARQRFLAGVLVKAGADIVVGHHPHVIQPVELFPRTGGRSPAPVFYSLGNALFDQHGLPDTRTGCGVNLILAPNGSLAYSTFTFEIDPANGVIIGLLPGNSPDAIVCR